MNRRAVLRTMGAALTLAAIPGWDEVFAQPADAEAPKRPSILRDAFELARRRGRPLLVLLGPASRGVESDHAQRWSFYLENGKDLALADLALCELACAFQDDFAREFPDAAKDLATHVMAVLIETDELRFTRIAPPNVVPNYRAIDAKAGEKAVDKHNREVELAFRAAVAPDRTALERRVAQSKRALSESNREKLGSLDVPAIPTRAHAILVPAWVVLRALDEPEKTHARIALLAQIARERWCHVPPPGARWARRGNSCQPDKLVGDGPRIDYASGPCGIGYTPPYSARFLWFYAESERDAFELQTNR